MGTYNTSGAYNLTKQSVRTARMFPGSKKTYAEEAPKRTKFVPPPGHYKYEKAYDKLSISPRAIRIHRH